mgnify:CR=1 FL=1
MNKSMLVGAVLGAVGVTAGGAVATYSLVDRGPDYAEVLAVTPINETVKTPREVCQDVTVTRYATFGDVVSYCRLSANPVGRLMLHLFGVTDRQSMAMSDGICTALQLVNFLQDVAVDWQKGRVYLPQSALAQYGLTEDAIARGDTGGLWGVMMRDQVRRARQFLAAGAPLGKRLPGRFGLELRLIVLGGETILRKLHRSGGDVFQQRPVLTTRDWLYMGYRALLGR